MALKEAQPISDNQQTEVKIGEQSVSGYEANDDYQPFQMVKSSLGTSEPYSHEETLKTDTIKNLKNANNLTERTPIEISHTNQGGSISSPNRNPSVPSGTITGEGSQMKIKVQKDKILLAGL